MDSAVSSVAANGLQLEYDTFGSPERPAILLIMGLGAQLTLWPESFCQRLAAAGYYVIRYDNRDSGLSTQLDALGKPKTLRAGIGYKLGLPIRAGYTLDDMADDAIGLLDALGIQRAHVVGASMGGMIAQLLGARFPQRVRSLSLLMTSRGGRRAAGPSLKVALRLLKRPETRDREVLVEYSLQTWKLVGSLPYLPPEDEMRELVGRQIDRAHRPAGAARQTLAIFASAGRKALLGRIAVPTLIVHGAIDPLIPVAAAFDLMRRIPGARLEVVPGMGHDLPTALLPQLADSILRHLGHHANGALLAAPRAARRPLLSRLARRRSAADPAAQPAARY